MKSIPLWVVVIAGVIALACFGAGWQTANWQRDSVELFIQQATRDASEATRQQTQQIADASGERLEQKLEDLRNAPPKEIYREIVKPVFTNRCLSPEFVSLYNENVNHIERILSGQSVKEVP
ncbi:hypothetical protein [Providencia hangzhouensis]|uniref:hypothetical protein n=1 Tax=Providencia hangzhouensis TaxID=3031799 RepID=UPI0034DD998D